jgi:predicted metal-dependent hydrolase
VRVHPRLDDARAPEEFVRYILFHEMLHAVVTVQSDGRRQLMHPPAFRKLERSFPRLREMRSMARDLVDTLGPKQASDR